MKKQLIVLSALFAVVSATQCSFYDRMKASASAKYQSAKATVQAKYQSAKATIQKQLPAVKDIVTENLPAVQEFAKTNILPTAKRIMEDQLIVGDKKLKNLMSGTAGGEQAFDKVQEIYMNENYPSFEKRADGEWVDSSKATSSPQPMSDEDRAYMESLK
jgi:hypothetical protein